MSKKDTLIKIKKLALEIDHNSAFDGKSKGNKHLIRIVSIAKFLMKKTNANPFIVTASAWLHDTALPSGDDSNFLKNKKIVNDLLKPFNLSENEILHIAECVASHEGTTKPESLEAKIIHDADVLEKTGLLGIIRHTWKMTNLNIINPQNLKDKDINNIINHLEWRKNKIHTQLAKKISKSLIIPINKQTINMIIMLTANMATQGIITEDIACMITRFINKEQDTKLKEQLNLKFLNKFK